MKNRPGDTSSISTLDIVPSAGIHDPAPSSIRSREEGAESQDSILEEGDEENNASDLHNAPVGDVVDRIGKLLKAQEARIIESINSAVARVLAGHKSGVRRMSQEEEDSGTESKFMGPWLKKQPSKSAKAIENLLAQEKERSFIHKDLGDVFAVGAEIPRLPTVKKNVTEEKRRTSVLQKQDSTLRRQESAVKRQLSNESVLKRQGTNLSGANMSRKSIVSSFLTSSRTSTALFEARAHDQSKKTKVMDEIHEMSKLANEISNQGQAFALRHSNAMGIITEHLSFRDGVAAAVANIMNSRPVELLISSMIVLNAAIIGAQVDVQMRNPTDGGTGIGFRFFDIFFMCVFTLELAMRLVGDRFVEFFWWRNEKFSWNMFDSILVLSAFGEEIMTRFLDSTPDVSTLRLFRILRLVRVFRIIRVMRFFRDLRIMVAGIAQSMQSLIWALLLLFCIMYLVAVCVMQIAVEESESRVKSDIQSSLSEEDFNTLQTYFGSLIRTLYTLYLSITGGVDWGDAADPLFGLTWLLGAFFGIYIAFSVLCVLNIVTGVFVENCNNMTARDQDMVLMEQLENRRQWFEEVRSIFDAADADADGTLCAVEFVDKLASDVRMQAWLRKVGVHIESHSAQQLFTLLDLDGDGHLDFDEFASALQQVHGNARSIDLARIKHDTRMLRESQLEIIELCKQICENFDQWRPASPDTPKKAHFEDAMSPTSSERHIQNAGHSGENRQENYESAEHGESCAAVHGTSKPMTPVSVSLPGECPMLEDSLDDDIIDMPPRNPTAMSVH